ncbi:MAG TPA: hypothetical protein VFD73_14400 [Gemmatimonadales bacterium]|nr:hypothetical protein [Gemmatimonadales bacterium]
MLKQSRCIRTLNNDQRGSTMLTTAVLKRLAVSLFFVATVSAPALLVA